MGLPDDKEKMLLGKHAPVVEEYAPQLLYPIARAAGRKALGTIGPMHGADLWHAYELSWLNSSGKPVVRVGRFHIPVDSPNMIESKSFKLYLNSLNSHRFDSEEQAVKTILGDVSAAVGQGGKFDKGSPNGFSVRCSGACSHHEGACHDCKAECLQESFHHRGFFIGIVISLEWRESR